MRECRDYVTPNSYLTDWSQHTHTQKTHISPYSLTRSNYWRLLSECGACVRTNLPRVTSIIITAIIETMRRPNIITSGTRKCDELN